MDIKLTAAQEKLIALSGRYDSFCAAESGERTDNR